MNRKTVLVGIFLFLTMLLLTYRLPTTTEVPSNLSDYKVATFAGGCFWCMEAAFEATDGVIESISGYTGGQVVNPTYKQVKTKTTGHLEAVQVYYDPTRITYEELLDVFWRNIDPTDDGGQFVDRELSTPPRYSMLPLMRERWPRNQSKPYGKAVGSMPR